MKKSNFSRWGLVAALGAMAPLSCGGSGQSGDGDDMNGGDGDGDLDGTGGSSSSDGGSGTGSDSGADAGGTSGDSGGNGNTGSGGSSTPSSGCGSDTDLMDGRHSIDVAGTEREYILRLPEDYDSSQAYPLVFTWHPLGGSAEFIANMGYYGLVDASGGQAIFVSPEGLVGDEDGNRGWWNAGGEDMDFYHAMLDLFTSELCFDEERIFSTGFSFGAMFSFNLACSEDSGVRAIAPQAGSAFGGCGGSTRPVATFGFIGVDDSLLDGHRSAMQSFVERNGCSEPVEMETSWCDGLDEDEMPCTCWEYQGCDAGYPVIECEFNAGHTFAPNAADTTWEFFSQF